MQINLRGVFTIRLRRDGTYGHDLYRFGGTHRRPTPMFIRDAHMRQRAPIPVNTHTIFVLFIYFFVVA